MANVRVPANERNNMLEVIQQRLDGAAALPGYLRIYSGTQPAAGGAVPSDAVLLAELTLSRPATQPPSNGTLTFNAIPDAIAIATGNATWARLSDGNGKVVFDGDVGTNDAFIMFNTTDVRVGGPVRVVSLSITLPSTMSF